MYNIDRRGGSGGGAKNRILGRTQPLICSALVHEVLDCPRLAVSRSWTVLPVIVLLGP